MDESYGKLRLELGPGEYLLMRDANKCCRVHSPVGEEEEDVVEVLYAGESKVNREYKWA